MTESHYNAAVVVCTLNPDQRLLERCLEGITAQILREGLRIQLILVDNNSRPEVLFPTTVKVPANFDLYVRREKRQGLVFARMCGISALRAPIAIFVDDDNILAPDYVQNVIDIFSSNSRLGAIGGRTHLETTTQPSRRKAPFLAYLGVRDYGDQPLESCEDKWGPWEPIGAGMAVRAEVARAFANFVNDTHHASKLGRTGTSLNSCEDSLMARLAARQGYMNAYRPELALIHVISVYRLRWRYLLRLLFALGRSSVTLETVLNGTKGLDQFHSGSARLLGTLVYRVSSCGVAGVCQWAWDLGAYVEARSLRKGRSASQGEEAAQ